MDEGFSNKFSGIPNGKNSNDISNNSIEEKNGIIPSDVLREFVEKNFNDESLKKLFADVPNGSDTMNGKLLEDFVIYNDKIKEMIVKYIKSNENFKDINVNNIKLSSEGLSYSYNIGERKKIIEPEAPRPQQEPRSNREERNERRFNIIRRERAVSDSQRARNRDAFLAATMILATIASIKFNQNLDVQQLLQHEMNALYSWQSFLQYIQDLGPLTTLLTASSVGLVSRFTRRNRELRQARQELQDYTRVYGEELGGNNGRTR